MADEETPEQFPESEVDNLIADFGKKPEPNERDKLREMLLGQKDQFMSVSDALDKAEEQEQGKDLEQELDR